MPTQQLLPLVQSTLNNPVQPLDQPFTPRMLEARTLARDHQRVAAEQAFDAAFELRELTSPSGKAAPLLEKAQTQIELGRPDCAQATVATLSRFDETSRVDYSKSIQILKNRIATAPAVTKESRACQQRNTTTPHEQLQER